MTLKIREENRHLEAIDNLFPIKYIYKFKNEYDNLPTIYIITPTYKRITQFSDLNRLVNTLLLVPKIKWIIVEDSDFKSKRLAKFLKRMGIEYHHLSIKSPWSSIQAKKFYKGSVQRNKALDWLIRQNKTNGVVYFADDDNSYDLEIFEEIRYTKTISTFPIAFVGGLLYEKPICKNKKIVDYFFYYKKNRKYPIDMAAFAINIDLINKFPHAKFPIKHGNDLEGTFLEKFKISLYDFEPKGDNCSKFFVWHTKTKYFETKKKESYERDILNQI